jgi:non-specific serine/threonine protein kinase
LPLQLTSFVGREHELAEIECLLSRARLVTLSGAGGIGKTRLALELAARQLETYRDGVWRVELAGVADQDLVPRAVASALQLRELSGQQVADKLGQYFRERQVLLVLDNCEHLVGACAALVEDLLRTCPELHVLATSREALNVPGEVAWIVPSLSLAPTPQDSDAVRLFVDRAAAAAPGVQFGPENAAAIAEICRRLDGIPLAIELAAARARVLGVDQIRERLADQFGLLTSGSRTALPRHQTLRALVDWSYDLLDQRERRLLARLSVFAAGWTLEAAESVCSDRDLPREHILEALAGLVDKSLVVAERTVARHRYRLLEPLRQYAAARLLEQGEEADLRTRHLAWFAEFAERAGSGLVGPDQASWFKLLDDELDNLRAALAWSCHDPGRVEAGLRVAAPLWRFWYGHGSLTEASTYLSDLLATASAGVQTSIRAKALGTAGRLATDRMDLAAARQDLEEALDLCHGLADGPLLETITRYLGVLATYEGDLVAGQAHLTEALRLARQQDDPMRVSFCVARLGLIDHFQGATEQAVASWEEALELSREVGDIWHVAQLQAWLAKVDLDRGRLTRARQRLAESLATYRDIGDTARVAVALEGLASLAALEGQPERALRLAGAVAARYEVTDLRVPAVEHEHQARRLAKAHTSLPKDMATRAWAEGRAMTLDQAVAYGLAADAPTNDSIDNPLTSREREVAALVARGLTNREIAAVLVISPGTARIHVDHILGKLGFRSRAEIAAWAVRQHIDEPWPGPREPGSAAQAVAKTSGQPA